MRRWAPVLILSMLALLAQLLTGKLPGRDPPGTAPERAA
jgi:hypothetical protein